MQQVAVADAEHKAISVRDTRAIEDRFCLSISRGDRRLIRGSRCRLADGFGGRTGAVCVNRSFSGDDEQLVVRGDDPLIVPGTLIVPSILAVAPSSDSSMTVMPDLPAA